MKLNDKPRTGALDASRLEFCCTRLGPGVAQSKCELRDINHRRVPNARYGAQPVPVLPEFVIVNVAQGFGSSIVVWLECVSVWRAASTHRWAHKT